MCAVVPVSRQPTKLQLLTYSVFEAATAKVAGEPGQGLVHLCPDLKVAGIPVVRQVELQADVAEDGHTTTSKLKSQLQLLWARHSHQ